MKKVLSLLMMAMLAFGAWAETEYYTLDGTTTGGSNGYATESEITQGDMTWMVTGNTTMSPWRIGGKSIENTNRPIYSTTPMGAAVTKVSLEVGAANNITVNSLTLIVASDEDFTTVLDEVSGSFSANSNIAFVPSTGTEWAEDAYYKFVFNVTVSGSTNRFVEFKSATFYEDGGSTPSVATPVITGETPFTESTEVTISCSTTGATIYYTTDGNNPTSTSTEYTAPFTLTESATVKAIAYDANNNASSVASKEFVKEQGPVTVATVAEFNALDNNAECTFTGTLVVSAQSGQYLYAQDATGGILIYGTAGQEYNKLDVIPSGWTCKKTTFKGAPEATNPAGLAAATTQADLAPEEMTPAQVTLANAFKYAVIRGATISSGKAYVGDESVTIYDRFGKPAPTDGGIYDIIGVTGYYNTPQFMPLEYVSLSEVATPEISGETPFVGSTTVTITCETDDVTIYYTTDGTDPTDASTLYTAPFELTEGATVKAIAYDATGVSSAIASMEFVKTVTVASTEEFDALGTGETFVFTGRLVVSGQKGKYLYAQDEDGGVLIYGTAPTYTKGDVIPAGFTATKTVYNGTVEMTDMIGMEAATEQAEIVAEEVVPADWDEDGINIYAVIKGATIDGSNLVVGENSVAFYNRFGVTAPTDTEKAYDVYGVTSWYNGAPQFYPLEYIEAVEPVAENTITFTAEQENGTIAVSLADGTPVESGVTKVAEGDKVTVTATAAEGYKIATFEVKCGEEVVPFDEDLVGMLKAENTEETHIFTMPADEVTINVTFEETTPTAIETINMENVKTVRYYNVAGVESATPFKGMNIVVREMNDGSKVTTKVVK